MIIEIFIIKYIISKINLSTNEIISIEILSFLCYTVKKGDVKMRNLTIKREKSFASALYKTAFYIEDYEFCDSKIAGVPCRFLGKIKNGETETFQIDNDAKKVFAIADKLSKSFCNDFYQLEAGDEDVFLSGENRYNPLRGNCFNFHSNDNPEALKNRKKGSIKGFVILTVVFLLCFCAGLFSGYLSNQTITPEDGIFRCEEMSISLGQDFWEYEDDDYEAYGYDAFFYSENVSVSVIKDDLSLFDDTEIENLEDYANMIIADNRDYKPSKLQYQNGIPYFTTEFTNEEYNEVYKYCTFLFQSDNAYWIVEFSTYKDEYANYANQINSWARSVNFENEQGSI